MAARVVAGMDRTVIYELPGSGDGERIDAMLDLYQRLFPKYGHYIPRMRRRVQFGNEHRQGHVVHYWLVEVDGQPAAIRTFRYIRQRRCGLAHALAVDPQFREEEAGGRRLSMFVVHECLAQIIRDAGERGDPPVLGMVNEVEPARLMEHYQRNGLIQLPVNYREPIFPSEAPGRSRAEELKLVEFSPMHLGFLKSPGIQIESYSREMIADFTSAFLIDHYGLPEDHPVVVEIFNSIGT
ncbi:MAG: hypothetical protein IPG44_10615 [Anaerolineales bacterium]|jgi:hypothetical protein|nr:hypothetical protein [Anaerolineales bacterium]MCC6985395.1 hypothetical protein [Anaerolineales bacterium]